MSTDQAPVPPEAAAPKRAGDTEKPPQAFKEASESARHIAGDYMSMASDGLAAAMKSSAEMSRSISDIGRAYSEACACYVSTVTEIGRDSLACRTPADLIALEKKAFDGLGTVAEASAKVFNGVFASYSRALEPILARAAAAPERAAPPAAE